jgi:hypothetical protein
LSSGREVPVRDIKKEAGGGCRTYQKVEDATRGSQHKKAWKEDGVGYSLGCKYFIGDGNDSFFAKSYSVITGLFLRRVCKFYRTLLL